MAEVSGAISDMIVRKWGKAEKLVAGRGGSPSLSSALKARDNSAQGEA
jgi:hypothetical protein